MNTYPSTKDPSEIITVAMDFAPITSAPTNPVVSVSRAGGSRDDPSPEDILSGSPQVNGSRILQKVVGGLSDVDYRIRWQVDVADGSRYVEAATLQVRDAR